MITFAWSLSLILMGIEGPFPHVEQYQDYQSCKEAQAHFQADPLAHAGRCRIVRVKANKYEGGV